MTEQYQVIWLPVAKQDIIDILEYIAIENISAAKKIVQNIQKKAETLKTFPKRGRIIPELQNIGVLWYRELLIQHWSIMYRIEQQTVYVLAVVDRRRYLETLLLERLVR